MLLIFDDDRFDLDIPDLLPEGGRITSTEALSTTTIRNGLAGNDGPAAQD